MGGAALAAARSFPRKATQVSQEGVNKVVKKVKKGRENIFPSFLSFFLSSSSLLIPFIFLLFLLLLLLLIRRRLLRPDITVMVDWALKINCLSIFLLLLLLPCDG